MKRLLLCLLLFSSSLEACQVPVFRYALERWVSDPYQVSVLHDGSLNAAAQQALQQLQTAAADDGLNLRLTSVDDLSTLTEDQAWLLDAGGAPLPQVQVRYPLAAKVSTVLLRSPLTPNRVANILTSPLRKTVQSHIVEGASAVWVLVETDNDADNQSALAKLQEHLKTLQSTLELPEGVIGNEAFAAGTVDATVPGFEMDNVLRSTIPLQIQFPIVRLHASDDAEVFFRKMLLGAAPDLGEPVAVPVFGRGRMMPGLPTSRISLESLTAACTYLCGACSCQVKEQNPGIDLLIHARWDDLLQGQLMIRERALPPLAGVGDLQTVNNTTITTTQDSTKASWSVRSILIVVLAGVLVLITSATAFLMIRTRTSHS